MTFASVRETGMLRIIEQKAGIKFKRAGPPQVTHSLLRSPYWGIPLGHIVRWAAVVRSCLPSLPPSTVRFPRGGTAASRRCACTRTRRRAANKASGLFGFDPPATDSCTAAAAVCSEVCACVQASDVVKAAKNDIIASLERLHQGRVPLEYP